MKNIERRKMERFPMKLSASFSFSPEKDAMEKFESTTDNICAGGAFVRCLDPKPVGTDFKIDLALRFNHTKAGNEKRSNIQVNGSVVRRGDGWMAVRFKNAFTLSPIEKAEFAAQAIIDEPAKNNP